MANLSSSGKKKKGIVKLKVVMEKLRKSLVMGKKSSSSSNMKEFEDVNVPADVKEGHFAVVAVDDDELKRFVVPLSYLTLPSFLRLLDEAANEYGFGHQGALTVPCRPCELQRILSEPWVEERETADLVETIVRIC